MRNVIEIAAWVYVVKHLVPVVMGVGFVLGAVLVKVMDEVTGVDTNYTGIRLRRKSR